MQSDTDNPYQVSVSRTIPATPEEIFDVLTDTEGHVAIDGSDSVKGTLEPQRLEMGSKFGMKMHVGIPYRIKNTVVEFEPNRLIAWQHFGRHRWRYELEPVDEGTLVAETFDWSRSWSRKAIEMMGYPKSHPKGMTKTLENLESEVLRRRTSE